MPLFPPKPTDMPEAEAGRFIATLNKMGYMALQMDEYSRQFADESRASSPVLEVGAAYGVATQAALSKGATVFANDLDKRHLDILYEQTPHEARPRLRLEPGNICDELEFKPGTFGGILCCRVLHFMREREIRMTLAHFHKWLKAGGKVFVVCETPYMKPYYSFVPIFEKRRKNGDPWPGLIEDPTLYNTDRKAQLPKFLNWMHPEILERELALVGFKIERSGFIPRPYFPEDTQGEGRESCGIVGVK